MGCNVKPRYRIFCRIFTEFSPNLTAPKIFIIIIMKQDHTNKMIYKDTLIW